MPWIKVFFITPGDSHDHDESTQYHPLPAEFTKEDTMPYTRKHCTRESKQAKKKRDETISLQNVISLRISDQEKKMLEKLTKATSKSVTDIMREAMDLWKSKRRSSALIYE